MDQVAGDPEVIARASARDDDSSVFLQVIREPEGDVSVAIWGTEDQAPEAALAYTLLPEASFIAFLQQAGYRVEREGRA